MGDAESNEGAAMRPQTNITSKALISREHVEILLGTLATLRNYFDPPPDGGGVQKESNAPEEVKTMVGDTIIRTCDRLMRILSDDARWSVAGYETMEQIITLNLAQNNELLKAQTLAAQQMRLPSWVHRPALYRTEGGMWAAIHNDPLDATNRIVGVGRNPAEAYQDFDRTFVGLQEDREKLEPLPEAPETKKKKRGKK